MKKGRAESHRFGLRGGLGEGAGFISERLQRRVGKKPCMPEKSDFLWRTDVCLEFKTKRGCGVCCAGEAGDPPLRDLRQQEPFV